MKRLAPLATLAALATGLALTSGCSDDGQTTTAGQGGDSTSSSSRSSSSSGGGGDQGGGGSGGGSGGSGGSGECTAPADCPGTDTDCSTRTCLKGVCGVSFAPSGTATSDQSDGDCKKSACDGNGGISKVFDDADTLDDQNPCTDDTCDTGEPKSVPSKVGTACSVDGGKVCDGAAKCVECLVGADCASGICGANACVAATCNDTVKNGAETDIDCGGVDCGACDDTLDCVAAGDCKSGVCANGTCAAPTCADTVKNGAETDADCGGPLCDNCADTKACSVNADCVSDVCMGGACAAPTCADTKKNGAETGVDCGGPTCNKCATGGACVGPSDCASGVCNASVCAAPVCGDGVVNGSEVCDDGNASNTDACPTTCKTASCGDGFVQAGVEQCDDANAINTDACTSACKTAACGDGFVQAGEVCDDGNAINTDACTSTCVAASCGDGFVQAGVEQCDDANAINTDGCTSTCKTAACGDGFVQAGEQCDDANVTGGDCCSSACGIEAGCEVEPNNECAMSGAAVAVPALLRGAITPIGDLDFYAFTVPVTADVKIETFEGSVGSCASADTVLELRGANCTTLLAYDDELGVNSCSKIDSAGDQGARRLAPGTYYVRVEDYQSNGIIPSYLLQITFNALCGDGVKEGSEQCDDSNVAVGDGCNSSCEVEPTPEAEANNSCAEANGPYVVPLGTAGLIVGAALTPIGDEDWFAFTISGLADVKIETFDATGPGSCIGPDTEIQVFNSDCSPRGGVMDQGAINNCSRLDPALDLQVRQMPAGTYYVKVNDYQNNTEVSGYTLQVAVIALCGNGVVEGTEECDGTPSCSASCELPRESVCNDGLDDDADGLTDCADTNCALGCAVAACGAGEKLLVYTSRGVPAGIPDLDTTTVTMSVPFVGTVKRAVTSFSISHIYIEDIEVSLTSPGSSTIDLTSDNGVDFDNYTETVLDDLCASPIASGAAPFTGCFSPEEPLATFNGQPTAGVWTLTVGDDDGFVTGMLTAWSLALCAMP